MNTCRLNYGIYDIDAEPIMEVFRSSENECHDNFFVYQDVTLLPGEYKLEVQGFYRDGDNDDAANRRSKGNEKIDAYLFAGDEYVALKSIFSNASLTKQKGYSTQTSNGYYVPNTFTEAGYCFQKDVYNNELFFTVDEQYKTGDGYTVMIGIFGDMSNHYNNWTAFDNFRLTYYGNTSTAINDVKSQRDVDGDAVYSLSGQRLATPRKGLNIIGGKKVVMK